MHIAMKRFQPLLIVPLLFGLLLAAGCQPSTSLVKPGAAQIPAAAGQAESADYSCSYFYFLWGRHAELDLNPQEALEAYEKALICDPQADYIARKIPVLLLRLGRGREAVAWLKSYLVENPREAGSRMLLAKILIRRGRYDEAAGQYLVVHKQHPREDAALLLLSELYLNRNRPVAARKALQEILDVNSQSYPAHVLLARLYLGLKQYDDALAEYDKALKINWSEGLLMEISNVYLLEKHYGDAIATYRQIIEKNPKNEKAYIALVNVYLMQHKEHAALAELNRLKAVTLHPEQVDLTIARLYARLKEYDKSIQFLRDALHRNNIPRARYMLAILYCQTKRYDQALIALKLIGRNSPEYKNAVFLQVRILREQKKPDQALEVLEQAISREGGKGRSPGMFVLLARLYQVQGKKDLSRQAFDRGLALYPDDDKLLYTYGIFLDTIGEPDQALSVMQRVIKRQPRQAAALNYVGYSWADKHIHLDQALGYIKRAVELMPESGYIRDSLGWVYYRLGRNREALDALEQAVKLLPNDATIYTHLGDVLLELGRTKDALAAYRKAISLLKKDDKARKSLQKKVNLLENQEHL